MVERVFQASSLNVAMQDGIDAGQSVPHVHTHIIPRRAADLEDRGGSDAIYGMLDGEEGDIGSHLRESFVKRPRPLVVDETKRIHRTEGQMIAEARQLALEMEKTP